MATKIFATLALMLPLVAGCGKQPNKTGEKLTPGTTQFKVSADNAPTSYTINGLENPVLTLKRGTTYFFEVKSLGHPIYILWSAGGNPANAYTNGVSGNGVEVGILTFTVPSTAPNALYYGSSVDSAMSGTIMIEN